MKRFAELLRIPVEPPTTDAAVSEVVTIGDLVREDVRWESLDGQIVPAYTVRPLEVNRRMPAVICLHGTGGSREAVCLPSYGVGEWKGPASRAAHSTLLGWGSELARRGYLTLTITQRGLDVRSPDTNDQSKDLLVRGRTLMGAIVYEIRQAITYLQTRDDVDAGRIGLTGISFGGITGFYTWLVDDRLAAIAPICGGIGSVDVLLREGVPSYHGLYWWIPEMLQHGDQGDYAAAQAPRPLMVWAPLDDIGMPAAGVDRFIEKVRPPYGMNAEALEIHQPPGEHALSPEAFEAAVQFFKKNL